MSKKLFWMTLLLCGFVLPVQTASANNKQGKQGSCAPIKVDKESKAKHAARCARIAKPIKK